MNCPSCQIARTKNGFMYFGDGVHELQLRRVLLLLRRQRLLATALLGFHGRAGRTQFGLQPLHLRGAEEPRLRPAAASGSAFT